MRVQDLGRIRFFEIKGHHRKFFRKFIQVFEIFIFYILYLEQIIEQ
jgi:hypothetical protein